jgi:hypothetical protein
VRAIPEDRVAAALGTACSAPPDVFALEAGAPDFNGTGWHQGEPVPGGSLRWSGTGRCASILLPPMGGRLRLSLSLRTPFHQPLELGEHEFFLDGLPLALRRIRGDEVAGVFEAEAALSEAALGTRHLLLIHGQQWHDPAPGPRRDTRRLGLGLHWLRVERAEAGEA